MMNKELRLLQLSQLCSVFAGGGGTMAVTWLVYEVTGSKAAMGGLWMVMLTGQLLIQFCIGPYMDRYRRTSIMKGSEIGRVLIYLAVLTALYSGIPAPGLLYAAAFLASLAVYDTAAAALIPKLAAGRGLVRINAKLAGPVQLVRFLALPAAGLLLSAAGAQILLWLTAGLYFISLLAICRIEEGEAALSAKERWAAQFVKGLAVYKQHKILLVLGGFISVTSFGVYATQAMYLPYVHEILKGGSFEYGLFAAAFPFGYVFGSALCGKWKIPARALYPVMLCAIFLGGWTYIGLGLARALWLALLIETAAGILMPFWNIYSSALYQKLVPQTILGQVQAVRFLLTKAAAPLGILYGTAAASGWGLPLLFLSTGSLIVLVSGLGLAGALFHSMREHFSKPVS